MQQQQTCTVHETVQTLLHGGLPTTMWHATTFHVLADQTSCPTASGGTRGLHRGGLDERSVQTDVTLQYLQPAWSRVWRLRGRLDVTMVRGVGLPESGGHSGQNHVTRRIDGKRKLHFVRLCGMACLNFLETRDVVAGSMLKRSTSRAI